MSSSSSSSQRLYGYGAYILTNVETAPGTASRLVLLQKPQRRRRHAQAQSITFPKETLVTGFQLGLTKPCQWDSFTIQLQPTNRDSPHVFSTVRPSDLSTNSFGFTRGEMDQSLTSFTLDVVNNSHTIPLEGGTLQITVFVFEGARVPRVLGPIPPQQQQQASDNERKKR